VARRKHTDFITDLNISTDLLYFRHKIYQTEAKKSVFYSFCKCGILPFQMICSFSVSANFQKNWMKKILLLGLLFGWMGTTILYGQEGNFFLHENGVTVMCPDAEVGDSGEVNGVTYTKRTRDQITEGNASTTCTSGITDMSGMFSGNQSFNEDISHWDVSSVTTMESMFQSAFHFNQPIGDWDVSSVTTMETMFQSAGIFNQPIGEWDVSNVMTMKGMFLISDFNQPIGSWNVSSVTNMESMFERSGFNQPIGDWDVSNVTTMESMFWLSPFDQPIGGWDVGSVTDMKNMFSQANSFNQDIGSWNVSNVTNMSRMFWQANSFNQDIGNWDVSSVKKMDRMFQSSSFNQPINSWDVSNVTDMEGMFRWSSFNQPIGGWDVSSVTNMAGMFYSTPFNQPIGEWDVSSVTIMAEMFWNSFFNQSIGDWDVSSVTTMESMFERSGFNQPIGGWDVSSVTNMNMMFWITTFDQPIDNWDVSSVTNMSYMFYDSDFNQPIGDWDVSNVTSMSRMFNRSNFNQPIGDWDVSSVTFMGGMFNSSDFNQPIGDWDVSSVTSMWSMFSGSNFNQPIGNWDVSSVMDMESMFLNSPFNQPIGTWDVSSVTRMNFMFAGATSFDQNIGSWDVSSVTDMRSMFRNTPVFNQDISSWNVSIVFNMIEMFYGAAAFDQNLGGWDISNVSYLNIRDMLSNSGLSSLNYDYTLSGWAEAENTPSNMQLGAEGLVYCNERIRTQLRFNYNWTITGDTFDDDECSLVLPERPQLSLPGDMNENIPTDTEFKWYVSERADYYRIMVSDNSTFNNIIIDEFLSDTLFTNHEEDFQTETEYFWAVRAFNDRGQSQWSEIWSFTTITTLPEAPLPVSPEDGAENVVISPLFTWQETPNTETYHLQLALDNSFEGETIVADTSMIEGTEFAMEQELESITQYFWRVRATNEQADSDWSSIWSFTTEMATSLSEDELPVEFTLSQNYPNPFNPVTIIEFGLPEATNVQLEVFDMVGRRVTVLENGMRAAGWHELSFDASSLSSGMYIYRIQAGEFVQTRKMMLVK